MSEQEQTIDLRVLLKVLTEHLIPIIIATFLAAAIGFSLAAFIIPKTYTSSALMYVENSSSKQEDTAVNVNDISAAQKLVQTCVILFTSDQLLKDLSTSLNEEFTAGELKKMITIESVNNTEVLKMSVVTEDPEDSYRVANQLISLSKAEFMRVIKNGSIETVSSPEVPKTHTFPSATRFALIGALVGLAASYFLYLLREMLDIKVKPDDDLSQIYDIPVFAEILDFETAGKSGYKYYKYKKYSSYDNYGGYDKSNRSKSGSSINDDDEDDDDEDEEDIGEEKVSNG